MDIQTRKIRFVQRFLKLESEEVLAKLESIIKKETTITYNSEEIEPMTLKEFEERIEKSMEDARNGRVISAEDLKKKIDKWN
mgnify:CR=1 FL=1